MDLSADDTLTKWWLMTDDPIGTAIENCQKFHGNSQGLNLLDRYVGQQLLCAANLAHRIYGLMFATYMDWCHAQQVAPKGRVLASMIALRFRLDRARGKATTVLHLYKVALVSFKTSDIINFVSRVRFVMVQLEESDLAGNWGLLYHWLWEKFRGWNAIAGKIEAIRESPQNSKKRTWNYLWTTINTWLDNQHEDENYTNLAAGIAGNKIHGAAATLTPTEKKAKKKAAKAAKAEKAAAGGATGGGDGRACAAMPTTAKGMKKAAARAQQEADNLYALAVAEGKAPSPCGAGTLQVANPMEKA